MLKTSPSQTSASGKMEYMYFFLFPLPQVVQIKILDITYNNNMKNNIKKSQVWKKKEDWQGISGSKEQHNGEFPGFYVCFIYSGLVPKDGNPKIPIGIHQKKKRSPKACSL